MHPIITLTTDFGAQDAFVSLMKAVILRIAPQAQLIDISHEVLPGDLLRGALLLEPLADAFPPGTIHLAVVDPGVGSSRAALAVETSQGICIAPDNGLLTLLLARTPMVRAVELNNPLYHRHPVSATFHGRDIFAPAAAHLAAGVALTELGQKRDFIDLLDVPAPTIEPAAIHGQVLSADRFGNLVTNITAEQLHHWTSDRDFVSITAHIDSNVHAPLRRTFSDVSAGHWLAYRGSLGRVELAIREGNAAAHFGQGVPVTLVMEY